MRTFAPSFAIPAFGGLITPAVAISSSYVCSASQLQSLKRAQARFVYSRPVIHRDRVCPNLISTNTSSGLVQNRDLTALVA